MDQLDAERERQRLSAIYRGMSDGELQKVAQDSAELSEIAVEVLAAEAQRRGLDLVLAALPLPMRQIEERELVVVRQFRDMPEALVSKTALDSAAIECFLVDDNMVRLDWLWSNLLGGIKLAVNPEDGDAALEILDQPMPESFEVEGLGTYAQPHCPRCFSINIRHEGPLDKRFLAVGMFLKIPIPVPLDGCKCETCGAEWREDSDTGAADHPNKTSEI